MQKYGIIATARTFKNPVRDCFTSNELVHTIITYYDDEPAYITVKDNGDSVDIDLNRKNKICKTEGLFVNGENEVIRRNVFGFYFSKDEFFNNSKEFIITFTDNTSIKFDLNNIDYMYKELKKYVDSGYTIKPGLSSLEKAAELLADDEFDDI